MTDGHGRRLRGQSPPPPTWAGTCCCVFDREETVGGHDPGPWKPSDELEGLLQHATRPGRGRQTASPAPSPPSCGVPEDPVCGSGHCHIFPYWAPGPGKGHPGGLASLPPGRHPLRHPGGGPGEAGWESRDLRRHHVFPPWRFPYGPVPEALTFLCAPVGWTGGGVFLPGSRVAIPGIVSYNTGSNSARKDNRHAQRHFL